jgi:hypothetical protein
MISVEEYLQTKSRKARAAAREAVLMHMAALLVAEAALVLRKANPRAATVVFTVDHMYMTRHAELVEVVDADGAAVYVGDPDEDETAAAAATALLSEASRYNPTWPVGDDIRIDLPAAGAPA